MKVYSLCNRLKDLREYKNYKNYKQAYVAEYLNISQQVYSRYESGKHELPVRYFEPLSKLYNVSTDYLLGLSVTKDDITTLSEQKYGSRSLKELLNDIASLDSENIVLLNAYIDFLISRQKK